MIILAGSNFSEPASSFANALEDKTSKKRLKPNARNDFSPSIRINFSKFFAKIGMPRVKTLQS
jgi:hypothetical protein